METYIPDTETAFDWLNYHSLEIRANVKPIAALRGVSRLYIGEISCILNNCQSVS